MAGKGRRFVDYGFTEPKFKLIVKKKPIFDWALDSLYHFYKESLFVFVSLEGFNDFISKRCKAMGINYFKIITLKFKTDGQATTAIKTVQSLDSTKPLLIYNIDTHIDPKVLSPKDIDKDCDGWLLLFPTPGTHWSFAKLNKLGKVTRVAEKARISQFACTGLYYFKTVSLFQEAYFLSLDLIKKRYGEAYVAPLYNSLIENKKNITSKIINFKNIIPLGTPDEVLRFDSGFLKRYNINKDMRCK
jgi:dTDP-glucose pyrophosphorylase